MREVSAFQLYVSHSGCFECNILFAFAHGFICIYLFDICIYSSQMYVHYFIHIDYCIYIYVFFQLDVYIIGMYACGGAMLSISFIVCTCCFGWFQLLHFRPNVFGVFYVCTHVN